ncbi:hypothetical protein C7M84_019175 [Penaeus vannamei]|uniref:Uncharacterized protein n=1 Tax=Penaeus vannamei TaxID=6689 RepID=A0A423U976_PENVA|nr:hypothetical protein C7M84_019175 [Penaeus vannamei]
MMLPRVPGARERWATGLVKGHGRGDWKNAGVAGRRVRHSTLSSFSLSSLLSSTPHNFSRSHLTPLPHPPLHSSPSPSLIPLSSPSPLSPLAPSSRLIFLSLVRTIPIDSLSTSVQSHSLLAHLSRPPPSLSSTPHPSPLPSLPSLLILLSPTFLPTAIIPQLHTRICPRSIQPSNPAPPSLPSTSLSSLPALLSSPAPYLLSPLSIPQRYSLSTFSPLLPTPPLSYLLASSSSSSVTSSTSPSSPGPRRYSIHTLQTRLHHHSPPILRPLSPISPAFPRPKTSLSSSSPRLSLSFSVLSSEVSIPSPSRPPPLLSSPPLLFSFSHAQISPPSSPLPLFSSLAPSHSSLLRPFVPHSLASHSNPTLEFLQHTPSSAFILVSQFSPRRIPSSLTLRLLLRSHQLSPSLTHKLPHFHRPSPSLHTPFSPLLVHISSASDSNLLLSSSHCFSRSVLSLPYLSSSGFSLLSLSSVSPFLSLPSPTLRVRFPSPHPPFTRPPVRPSHLSFLSHLNFIAPIPLQHSSLRPLPVPHLGVRRVSGPHLLYSTLSQTSRSHPTTPLPSSPLLSSPLPHNPILMLLPLPLSSHPLSGVFSSSHPSLLLSLIAPLPVSPIIQSTQIL